MSATSVITQTYPPGIHIPVGKSIENLSTHEAPPVYRGKRHNNEEESRQVSIEMETITPATANDADSISKVQADGSLRSRPSVHSGAGKSTGPASLRSVRLDGGQPGDTFDMSISKERAFLITCCWTLFLAGWNDGTLGPLLPRIQENYGVNFTVVSMLFICQCVGFILGALMNLRFTEFLGFGKSMVIASIFQIVGYVIMAPAPPFPVLCVAYTINGIGIAVQDAGANAFIASIPRHGATNMGILHAVYGLGAFASPLVATQFAQYRRWSFHYLISVGIAVSNTIALLYMFRLKRQEAFIPDNSTHPETSDSNVKQIMRNKLVHFLAFFILVYVGVEVTIGGWIVTFLLHERDGGPSSGYVSSGFFGGLTLGRVVLLWVNKKVGERRVIYLYTVLAIALELTIWFVPSLIENAVAVSFVGMLLGPFYPISMNFATAVLPSRLLSGSIGWIAGFGQAGSAALPFMTGALASKHGVIVLQPLIVGMMGLMLTLWTLLLFQAKAARRE